MEQQSFTQKLLESEQMLYRISCSFLHSEEDRRDAMQETALKAWKHRDQLQEERYFRTWLCRILINECKTICRKNIRVIPMAEIPSTAVTEQSNSETETRIMLECLPDRQRIPIVLHYLEGFSLEEIAQVQHLTIPMVKYLMHQARKKLRIELNGKESDSHDRK